MKKLLLICVFACLMAALIPAADARPLVYVVPMKGDVWPGQVRVLEEGFKIKVIETKYDTVGVDTAEDLKKAEKAIKQLKE